jgi:hypothetical protein
MSSLLDLGPLAEEVEIRGKKLTIHGLTAADFFKLFAEFPDMGQAMGQLGSSAMLNMAPDLIAKVIAMVTGDAGNKEVEAKAKTMGAADQLKILSAAQRLSFPQGFGPFVEEITKLMGTMPVPTIPPENTVVSANSSRVPSSASLQTESPGMTRGTSPRAN